MEAIKNVVDAIRSVPGGDIAIIVSSVIAIASIIVKWTPTPKDNEVLEKIVKFLSKWVALNK